MNPPDMLLLDELPKPKQEDVLELIRYLRTALNAHKIYPIGHKMIVNGIDRLLKQVLKMSGGTPHFVISLSDDQLEFNGEKLKRRGNENQYVKEMAGLFKDVRLQTLVLRKQTQQKDVSRLFAKIVTFNPDEDDVPDLVAVQSQFSSLWVNATVVRRTVGDKVRDHMPDNHYISSAELSAVQEDQAPSGIYDPDEVLEALSSEVRSGRFFYELLAELPSSEHWPASTPSLQIGEANEGPTPLYSSGEFSNLSVPGVTEETVASSYGSMDDIGGELMLDMEDDRPSRSVPALPGMPPVGDLTTLPPDLRERFQEELTRQLDQMVPTMFNQYLQQLTKDPAQEEMRQSIIAGLSPEKIEASQEDLIDKMEQAQVREDMNGVITLYKEMVDQQLEQGILFGVSKALEQLESRSEASKAQGLKAGTARVIEHLQQEDKLEKLISHGVDLKGNDARQLLSQLAPSSLPQCIKALSEAKDRDERRRLAELLIELSRNASPEKREAGFAALLQQLGSFEAGDQEREFLLELLRSYSPIQFETYIIQHLSDTSSADERSLLMRHAIAHDSPKLRGLLTRLLENRALANQPEEEELLLQYLHRREVIDVVGILDKEIDNGRQHHGLRNSAIWLLGAIESEKAVAILERILSRRSDLDRPYYPESMRFQALHTLARLPKETYLSSMQSARQDDSLLLQAFAALTLNEPITISTLQRDQLLSEASTMAGEAIADLDIKGSERSVEDETTIPNDSSDGEFEPPTLIDDDIDPLADDKDLPDDWVPPPFWTKPRLIIAVTFGVLALLTIGWLIGRLGK